MESIGPKGVGALAADEGAKDLFGRGAR